MPSKFCDGVDCTPGRRAVVCGSCGHLRDNRAYGWCAACARRWERAGRPAGGPPPVRHVEHDDVVGTTRGWDLHRRRGTTPCPPCREAHAADMRGRYHAGRAGGAA
ncbi:hypothetical protein [Streptomyces sp. DH12]|uniref:hypothetical protein n=1 Tax=Streptomyces sp. DH12 TaxID=2857010 RepID=UPI001E30A4DD|nr:hypothetical protein [Streptomyces sp. DH12]